MSSQLNGLAVSSSSNSSNSAAGTTAVEQDGPPAFLDLADSAARLSSNLPDINARIEQKRVEHERARSAHRRMFEEQMRALEEQQLAEERALAALSAPGSPGVGVIGKRRSVNLEPDNAKSMPGSRRGSSGSGRKEKETDELAGALGGLRIGTGSGTGLGFGGAVSAVTAPTNGFLWDEALDREMQNSLRHLPADVNPPTAAPVRNQRPLSGVGLSSFTSSIPSIDPFSSTRKMSVSSVALDLANHNHHPLLPASRYLLQQQLGAGSGSEWPPFQSGSMTAGNGTPVVGGTPVLGGTQILEGRGSTPNLNGNRLSAFDGPRGPSPGGAFARSVPATPLSGLPHAHQPPHQGFNEVVPSPYPELSRYPGGMVNTPASAYEPVAFGSIAQQQQSSPYVGGGEFDYTMYAAGGGGGAPHSRQQSRNGSRLGSGGRVPSGGMTPVGGLHGPKHKRSDLDREYNRFSGTQLEELQGEIASMCKDQHGCRYLQRKLEDGIPEHVDMIFRETHPHFAELMTDPFGNYLCQKLLEHSSDEQRNTICQSVANDLVTISLNMHGTRAVQKMIDFLSNARQTDPRYDAQIHAIIVALGMHVVTLIKDLNGNHVVQKCLNKLAPEDNQFIYNAVANHCVEVATHRHGCCVLQRCVDHASDSQRVQLVGEITYHALTLVQDPYGNYVVQYILDLNDNRFSDAVIRQFLGNVCALSVQKFSSNVIEKCIRVAEHNTRKMLIEELLNRTRLEKLLRDSFGNYCVQTALDYAEPGQRAILVEYIRPILPLIRNTPYGKRIQSKLQREQMEAAHVGHYGGVPAYHANHAALLNLALQNNGNLGNLAAAVAVQNRPIDPYGANQGYQLPIPNHMHHDAYALNRNSVSSLANNGSFGGVSAYGNTGFGGNGALGSALPEQYGRTNYGYSM